jgi:hypothetical protein
MSPNRPRSHILEDSSRNQLRDIFTRLEWVVWELHPDYGEDFFVRIFTNGMATHYSFFVQAKATDNIDQFMHKDRKHNGPRNLNTEKGRDKIYSKHDEKTVYSSFCPVPAKIDVRISRKGTRQNGRETKAVYAGVQVQSGVGKLAAGHDARRGLSEVLGHLFDGESVASGVPAERAGDL